jgi:hypothetical protein
VRSRAQGLFFGVAQHSAKYIGLRHARALSLSLARARALTRCAVDAFFKPKREPVLIAVAAPRPPAAHEAVLAPPSAEPVAVAAPAPAPAEPAPAPAEPAPAEPAPEPAPQTPAPAPAPAAAPAQTQ